MSEVQLNKVWQKRVMERLDKSEAKRSRKRTGVTAWGKGHHFLLSDEAWSLFHAVAKARGISLSGYVRRALAKQMAADSGIPIETVLDLMPYPAEYGRKQPPKEKCAWGAYEGDDPRYPRQPQRGGRIALPDDGTGYGAWQW